jgi:hypothetical protein
MRMRIATLLAVSLILVGISPQDGARAQTSTAPPVSLAPPKASPPRATAKNSPAASDRTPPTGGLPQAPNPAADYDGFSAVDDNDTASPVTPPARSRAARGSKSNSSSNPDVNGLDQVDEALKQKLTICKNCK